MNRSQGHMRAHFNQKTISSSSLEGMERPVRSFKSFVQEAPPNPKKTDKALPPTPPPWNQAYGARTSPTTDPSSASGEASSATASWRAPLEWYNDGDLDKSAHSTPSPAVTPPTSEPRTFAPLLPEPSPGLSGMAERMSWLTPNPSYSKRLLPIYERPISTDPGPPDSSPPRTPLPATPSSKAGSIGAMSSSTRGGTSRSPSRNVISGWGNEEVLHSGSDKEKAYAALGLDPPTRTSDTGQQEPKRVDRQYWRGKKLRALHKGSPLVDGSWEDEEMDDRERQMSFSQDYHELLADQYQEMSVGAHEVLSTGGTQQVHDAQVRESEIAESMRGTFPTDHEAVPRPLSWCKSPDPSTPNETPGEQPSAPGKKSKHKRLSSFMRQRSVDSEMSNEEPSDKGPPSSEANRVPAPEPGKPQDDHVWFSKFFPSSGPLKFRRKQKSTEAPEVSTTTMSPSPSPQLSPLMRLPGGLAVVRTHSSSPSPNSKPGASSDKSPTSPHARSSSHSHFGSDYSPTTSDPHSSYNSNHTPAMANNPPTTPSAYRTPGGFSYSPRSSVGFPITDMLPPPAPPPPPNMPLSPPQSPPQSPPLYTETSSRLGSQDSNSEHRSMSSFIGKAKEARRKRLTEARHDKLKRSIRVLGPTDPGIAQSGYVKADERLEKMDGDARVRLSGYLVGHP